MKRFSPSTCLARAPCVLAPPMFSSSIMICNECICLWLLGWYAPFYFFIPSMFSALGLHQFFNKRSNRYKDKDKVWGMDVPPNTMESDSTTTLVQDSTAIFVDDGFWRTPQMRSNRHASQLASANIKLMYRVDKGGASLGCLRPQRDRPLVLQKPGTSILPIPAMPQ